MKYWVELDLPPSATKITSSSHSCRNPQLQLGTKIPTMDVLRVQSPRYSTKDIRQTSARSWFSLVLLVLACVFIFQKALSTLSLDILKRHPEHSTWIFSFDRDVVPLSTINTRVSDNGLTDEVQWDDYSLLLRGQRIFLQ